MGVKITFNTFTSLANETSFVSNLNENFSDLEAQIDLLLSRDGEAPNTLIADLDVNSQKLINLIDGTNATDAVNVRQLQGLALGDIPIPSQTGNADRILQTDGTVVAWGPLITTFAETFLDDLTAAAVRATLEIGAEGTADQHAINTGGVNALAASVGALALVDGLAVIVRATGANSSAAVTLDLDGLGAKSVQKFNSVALLINDIQGADQELHLVYNSSNDEFILANPKEQRDLSAPIALLNLAQVWTQQQNFGITTLTDATNITWDLNSNQVATVTLAGNRNLNNPTNIVPGGTYMLIVVQDGAGSRTLTFSSSYLFPGGLVPTLTLAGGSIDILTFIADASSNMLGVSALDFQ